MNPSFMEIAEQAVTGLKSDPEVYLEVRQELLTHLEDSAEVLRASGVRDADATAQSAQSFGSPLALMEQLTQANAARMRLRARLRLLIAVVITPLAILASLFVGYGRMVSLQRNSFWELAGQMTDGGDTPHPTRTRLPEIPVLSDWFSSPRMSPDARRDIDRLRSSADNAPEILAYWREHQHEADSHRFYAYYAQCLKPQSQDSFVSAMRTGERLEPENALYNMRLAAYYLSRGLVVRKEPARSKAVKPDGSDPSKSACRASSGIVGDDVLVDRAALDAGVTELLAASRKPYLRGYGMEIMQFRLKLMPVPRLTEEYYQRIQILADQRFDMLAEQRLLARSIGGAARLLLQSGQTKDAVRVMDTWKPYVKLLSGESEQTLIHALVTVACAQRLAEDAVDVYRHTRRESRQKEAATSLLVLRQEHSRLTQARHAAAASGDWRRYGGYTQGSLLPAVMTSPTRDELTPGRMYEHVLAESVVVQFTLVLLVIALLGALMQYLIWWMTSRGDPVKPLLILPSCSAIVWLQGLFVILPCVAYWFYSRSSIGGREYGLMSGAPGVRILVEMLLVALVILIVPAVRWRKALRKRCTDLGVPIPAVRQKRLLAWKRAGLGLGLLVPVAAVVAAVNWLVTFFALCVAATLLWLLARLEHVGRHPYRLFYGTVARSMTTLVAITTLVMALITQPWLLTQEVHWLRADPLIYGPMADHSRKAAQFSLPETRDALEWTRAVLRALDTKQTGMPAF